MSHTAGARLWFNVYSHAVGAGPLSRSSDFRMKTLMSVCGRYTITDDPMRVRFTEPVMTMQDQSEFFPCDIIFMTVMQESH